MGRRTLGTRVVRLATGGLAAAGLLLATGAGASGPTGPSPWYLDEYGGEAGQMAAVYAGAPGIVMARSPRPLLYLDWRLLHGQGVGAETGAALSRPCCDAPSPPDGVLAGAALWLSVRKAAVPGAPELPPFLPTARPGPNFTSLETCFPEAFETAAATLKDRVAREGGPTVAVRAWLATQDGVFDACGTEGATLPPPLAAPPPWLKADRAYQEAAFALYMGRDLEAADRFAAIGRDASSPWRRMGPYLQVRALVREALSRPSPAAFARAQAALAAFARRPADSFGRSRADDLRHVLLFRADPAALRAEIDTALAAHDPPAKTDVLFRDLSDLYDTAHQPSDALDWMTALRADHGADETADSARRRALAHAAQRWGDSRDPAWLLAALSLANAGDPEAAPLVAAGEALPQTDPAWLTVQLHLVRLGLASGGLASGVTAAGPSADRLRTRLDALLARPDLRAADRNLFRAQRLQLARDLPELARLALRRRICADPPADAPRPAGALPACLREGWSVYTVQYGGVFDGEGQTGTTGLGEDARAVIDRMPLAQRLAIAEDAALPERLRLDISLTSFARAVALQSDPAIDRAARRLIALLPQLADPLLRVVATPPGPDKRFAEFFVLSQIPGLRTDLVDYTRPEKTVADFQGYWMDWRVRSPGAAPGPSAPGPSAPAAPPPLAAYQQAGQVEDGAPDAATDLVCLGECGRGASPLRLPDPVAAVQAQALKERAGFDQPPQTFYNSGPTNPPRPAPPGTVSPWEEMLAWVTAHRQDPRAPEALYWLVHVGHFGGSHDHSGRRAFRLLHGRYPDSDWAKRAKFYYD